jgi:hypothetical protein
LRAKCGPTGAAVWAYQGRLVDPLNGLTIANVQGVELVRCLAVTDPTSAQRERYKRRAGDLAMASTLASASQSPNLEYAGTLLSRKLFCYTSPNNNDDSNRLLRKVRLRPTSPERNIPVNQAAAVYDTATTYCQVSSNAAPGGGAASSNPLWALHTEYSDGRSLWTTTSVQDDELQKLIEFTVYARPQPLWKQRLDWKRWLGPAAAASSSASSSSSVISPQRSAILQLGSSAGTDAVGKFGARETYQYNTAFGRCSCRYSRYGEGPAWYGPGRLCTLELSGRRVEAWSDLPSQIAQLVHERVVGFLSVNAPVPQDDVLASRAVQVFRGKGAAQLQIAPIDRDGSSGGGSSSRFGGLQRGWNRALSAWDRVRSATSVTLGGSSSSSGGSGGGRREDDDEGAGRRRRSSKARRR